MADGARLSLLSTLKLPRASLPRAEGVVKEFLYRGPFFAEGQALGKGVFAEGFSLPRASAGGSRQRRSLPSVKEKHSAKRVLCRQAECFFDTRQRTLFDECFSLPSVLFLALVKEALCRVPEKTLGKPLDTRQRTGFWQCRKARSQGKQCLLPKSPDWVFKFHRALHSPAWLSLFRVGARPFHLSASFGGRSRRRQHGQLCCESNLVCSSGFGGGRLGASCSQENHRQRQPSAST